MITAAEILDARILIVDDAEANTTLLFRMLGAAGYTNVTVTNDSRTVGDLYREHRYDLILLDLMMPGLDGFAVMQALGEIESEGYLPVLVLTAQPDQKLPALQAGAKDFIAKPFDRVEVLTRIHNMLEVRLLLRKSRAYGTWLELYDPPTGLPNRVQCTALLNRAIERGRNDGRVVALFLVSADRFRVAADSIGHEGGDVLLTCVANRLSDLVGPLDTVARLDGDVLALVVSSSDGGVYATSALARSIRDAMRAPIEIGESQVTLTVSIGIALAPADAPDATGLLQHAGAALRQARAEGGDTHRFFSPELDQRSQAALALETALRGALARNEFVLHYQPRMRIDTGEWSGVEALLRWNRPGHGLVQPAAFIAVLEDTSLIVPVGNWVIDAACRQVAEWSRSGLEGVRVAVNVSARQFLSEGFVGACARAIRDHGITPDLLHVEITETSLMARLPQTDVVLRALKQLGVWIAIDDFGTGYSSLAYLRRFPIDTIKIDISFIRDVTTSEDGAAIAVAIVNMARTLKMTVIAEGVETEPQLAFLRAHACDEIQGFYCSRPLPADELTAMRPRPAIRRGALTPRDQSSRYTIPDSSSTT